MKKIKCTNTYMCKCKDALQQKYVENNTKRWLKRSIKLINLKESQ